MGPFPESGPERTAARRGPLSVAATVGKHTREGNGLVHRDDAGLTLCGKTRFGAAFVARVAQSLWQNEGTRRWPRLNFSGSVHPGQPARCHGVKLHQVASSPLRSTPLPRRTGSSAWAELPINVQLKLLGQSGAVF